ISKVTTDSAQRIEEVARSSEDLTHLTETLSEMMSRFTINGQSNQIAGKSGKKELSHSERHLLTD
ncbi:MAG: hypothetical protein ACLFQX_13795, partial [Candidatus Kapaibacterium sp.]